MKHLKSWETFTSVNELRTETYSKIANSTSGYPTTRYAATMAAPPEDRESRMKYADKMGRVNDLAREAFIRGFLNEFPYGSTKIETLDGTSYSFAHIKFNANHTNYELMFDSDDDYSMGAGNSNVMWINMDGNGYRVETSLTITDDDFTDESKQRLDSMFRFMKTYQM
jgi:hypothetical protein